MSNIVDAQNKVLTKVFGVNCYMSKLECNIANNTSCNGIYVGMFSSYIEFLSLKPIHLDNFYKQGCHIVELEVQQDGLNSVAKYKGILLYRSNLRKKLFKVMLKYN